MFVMRTLVFVKIQHEFVLFVIKKTCICEKVDLICQECNEKPCICEGKKQQKIRIKLSDGKVRELESMSSTYFYVDGKPISAEEFLKRLFDVLKLPEILESEERLRELWANPMTRNDLLKKLENAGCHKDDLAKLQELIGARDSDLFDVLEYIAYTKPPVSRSARVAASRDNILHMLTPNNENLLSTCCGTISKWALMSLMLGKLGTILTAKYGGINAAQQKLGNTDDIRETFIEFQKHLYKVA